MSQQPEEVPEIQADPQVIADLESEAGSLDDDGRNRRVNSKLEIGSEFGTNWYPHSLRESTASLSSSVREFRTIKGRTYQTSNTIDYWAPNDDKQLETFDVVHHFTLMLMDDRLFYAPVPVEKGDLKVLDVGTGSGLWALDLADEFPAIEVIGTDISAVQPSWVPPNCIFQIDDAQLDWTFKRDHFDAIHARNLYGGIDNWQRFYDQAFTHLKPGGWFESMEFDILAGSENPEVENDPNHIFKKWAGLFWDAGDIIGRSFRQAQYKGPNEEIMMVECMKEAGFVDIVHKKWKVPIGGWAKDPFLKQVGHYAGLFMDQSLDGWALQPIGEILGWTYEEIMVLVAEMRIALRSSKSLPYFNYHMVYGRKPENPSVPPPASDPAPVPTQAAAAASPAPASAQAEAAASPAPAPTQGEPTASPAPAATSPGNTSAKATSRTP
ncbi:Secondary metabolism regulator LAE1 [Colletotrichum aenigma]|uniref:Secondary metabolism regulator LAE1 n=1 Tax=Colletotrichum aenigma TaxID=1215731 RepID=UPI0018731839|nr:Secondary metabolism regulator LAE1 [Colletotrichum aenigma]KAF5521498.1 Secondary metabolism regulator LAE1 [Colletotrichum aenigma]